jgi:large subunit ribosomal protein L18
MSLIRKLNKSRTRRTLRVRNRLKSNVELPRISVFRSLNQIYAQVIDDAKHQTLISCSSMEIKAKGDKKLIAKAVGVELAKRAREKGIETARFDRGSFLYHGRVKALAEGLREGGLKV